MRALNRKLWRDLLELRGMVLAIVLVQVGGIATFLMSITTYDSLLVTRDSYYSEQRFAEVFASLKRAPASLAARLLDIPGVERLQTRVVAAVRLSVPGFSDPATGTLVSIPETHPPLLNTLYLRRGRMLESGRDAEVLVDEAFADAHGLQPGDRLIATINGRRKRLDIVGITLSPEYVYPIAPGAVFPDYKRYGVLWMGRTALAAAYDMEGAFNDVALELSPGADAAEVVDRLDRLLARYGGRGAYARKDQVSHRFLSEELKGLETMATVFPVIFLGVAAFLLNVVITRLVNTQRNQIAILKAFGYSNLAVGRHYAALVLLIVLLGLAGGVAAGIWLGRGLSGLYMEFYRFPFLHYRLEAGAVILAGVVSLLAGMAGTVFALAGAVRLPPAEAMRPETPAVYRQTLIERLGLQRLFSQPTRMILRHMERRPVKTLLTVAGIAAAGGIVMVANFQRDAVTYMIDVQYAMAQSQDLTVTLTEPTSHHALYSLAALEGVWHVEGARSVPARLRHGHRSYRGSVQGMEPDGELRRVLDADLERVALPAQGVVLTDYLAELLAIEPGERLTVEVLEGSRPVLEVPLAGLTSEYLGVSAYMQRATLNRLLKEGDAVNGAYLAVDERYSERIYRALDEMPRVVGTVVRESAIRSFHRTMEETILFFTLVTAILGSIIAFGVIYNSARIALSERDRELASLRVLGFTRGEVAYILLGELAAATLLALPLGFLFGRALCGHLAGAFRSDLYRVPLVLEPDTYAFTASVVLVSAVGSGLLLWRKLNRLDLIGVLKTRE
ncbi:MAG: ABC transporter permease [Gammaproteobacteria bacterium]|jgi:putative ABC transport system permease protein